jgi:hypothetical protein
MAAPTPGYHVLQGSASRARGAAGALIMPLVLDAVVESIEVSVHTVSIDAPEATGRRPGTPPRWCWSGPGVGSTPVSARALAHPLASVVHDQPAGVVLGMDALDVGRAFTAMVAAVRNDTCVGVADLQVGDTMSHTARPEALPRPGGAR